MMLKNLIMPGLLFLISGGAVIFVEDGCLAEDQSRTEAKEAAPIFDRVIFIGVKAEKVWQGLTDPQIVNSYYLAPLAKIELKKGGEIYYGSAENRMISGKIEEIEPNRKLSHSFKFAHRPEDPPTIVTYLITPLGEMSQLELRHTGFKSFNATFSDISGGWDVILSSLKTVLETGKPLPWPRPEKK